MIYKVLFLKKNLINYYSYSDYLAYGENIKYFIEVRNIGSSKVYDTN